MAFKHFTYKEFDCKSGEGLGENMQEDFVCLLDDAREIAGIPFKITSGFRTAKYNQQLMERGYKCSPTSSHLKGVAADIEAKTSKQKYNIIRSLLEVGIERIGIGDEFIHCDIDREKTPNVIWTYY